jgi:hypothetical protein
MFSSHPCSRCYHLPSEGKDVVLHQKVIFQTAHFNGFQSIKTFCLKLQILKLNMSRSCSLFFFKSSTYIKLNAYKFLASCLLGLLFDPEDGGRIFLRNVSELLQRHIPEDITSTFRIFVLYRASIKLIVPLGPK